MALDATGSDGRARRAIARCVAGALIAAVLFSSRASAQTGTLAESLFRDARVAMKAGDAERACPLFAESYRLDPAFGTLFNLGACEEERGRLASAWAAFRKLIDLAPAEDERVVEAGTRLHALDERVPRLKLVVGQPLPPDHALELDGVALGPGAFEEALRVDPGQHTLRVVGSGEVVRSTELELAVGETRTVEVEPVIVVLPSKPSPLPRAEVAPTPRDRSRRKAASGPKVAAYTALGLGGAGVGASLVLGGFALRARDTTEEHCPGLRCDPEGMAAGERGARYASLATASAVAGLVGLAAGGFLLWTSSGSAVKVSGRGSGISVQGAF